MTNALNSYQVKFVGLWLFMNVPSSSSSNALSNSSSVFITIGPLHASGSFNGSPETKRNRAPFKLEILTESPLLKTAHCPLLIF